MLSIWEKINDEILPNALMMGVDYELFWSLDPNSLKPFVKAFSLKIEREDSIMWQHGMYIRMAVGSVLNEKNKYPEKPMLTMQKKELALTDEQRKEMIKARFLAHAEMLNSKIRKEN